MNSSAPMVQGGGKTAKQFPSRRGEARRDTRASRPTIHLRAGEVFAICFACPARLVASPDIEKILPGNGRPVPPQPQTARYARFPTARLHQEVLWKHAEVLSIHVLDLGGWARVYVNCQMLGGARGFATWAGTAYEKLVRTELRKTWKSIVTIPRQEPDGTESLLIRLNECLRHRDAEQVVYVAELLP